MAKPVLDQQDLSSGNDTNTVHGLGQITTLTDDEIIIVEYASSKTVSAQHVSSVTYAGTATVGTFTKLFELSNATNNVSVWWAHQTVKGTITATVNVDVANVSATVDGWMGVTSSYTGAASDQSAAAFATQTITVTTAGPVNATVTTTRANSLVLSVWNDATTPAGGDGNNLNGANTTQRWFDAFGAMTVSQWVASYTGSTVSPGSTTQVYNGFTTPSFTGGVAAYEILGPAAAASSTYYLTQAARIVTPRLR